MLKNTITITVFLFFMSSCICFSADSAVLPFDKLIGDNGLIKKGRMSINYYYDTRDYNNLTVNTSAKLPKDISFYQLLTLSSPFNSSSKDRWYLNQFYTEVNFRRPVIVGHEWLGAFDWAVQYVDGTTAKQRVRVGPRVRFHDLPGWIGELVKEKLGLVYRLSYYTYETDGEGAQLEHSFKRNFRDGNVYISGFVDQNLDDGEFVISEQQLGIRIVDELFYVTELRYNGLKSDGKRWGVGFGMEYVLHF